MMGFALLPLMIFARPIEMEPKWLFELLEIVGVFSVIGAVLGRFWSILYIGGHKNSQVIDAGPYSICRHPLYLFSTLGVIGLGLMLGSLLLAGLFGGLTFLALSMTAAREEAFLRAEFGRDYDAYARRVPRILPRLEGFTTDAEIIVSVRQLKTNFFDALVFLSFIPLAEILEGLKMAGYIPTFPVF
ncbi:isoprenylcysteine carboxylmethyltransferase family protein [Cribrihabitans sp. XS_ASV171]